MHVCNLLGDAELHYTITVPPARLCIDFDVHTTLYELAKDREREREREREMKKQTKLERETSLIQF